jgi:hypothetical protein
MVRDNLTGSVCDLLDVDTQPTVFLTISSQYDYDVQKTLLDLVSQLTKVLQGEKEARIRSKKLSRQKDTSILFDNYGHTGAQSNASHTRQVITGRRRDHNMVLTLNHSIVS